jgi:hypothetical protein
MMTACPASTSASPNHRPRRRSQPAPRLGRDALWDTADTSQRPTAPPPPSPATLAGPAYPEGRQPCHTTAAGCGRVLGCLLAGARLVAAKYRHLLQHARFFRGAPRRLSRAFSFLPAPPVGLAARPPTSPSPLGRPVDSFRTTEALPFRPTQPPARARARPASGVLLLRA